MSGATPAAAAGKEAPAGASLRAYKDVGPALLLVHGPWYPSVRFIGRWKQYRLRSCGCIYITDEDVRSDEPIWCGVHRNEG